MPLLWLFTHRNFNPSFKFKSSSLLHFLPAVGCFALFLANFFSQMFVYFTLIFVYLQKAKLQPTAQTVNEYLRTSQAYLNPNLTLHDVATAMDLSPKKLSKAINTVLNINFFELVNPFRVEKAKESLKDYKRKNLTLDSIAAQRGFNSRFTFSNTFKKFAGVTTTEWLSFD